MMEVEVNTFDDPLLYMRTHSSIHQLLVMLLLLLLLLWVR